MPKPQPTRPDLKNDSEWLVWLSLLAENKGIDVHGLFEKMVVWCHRKGLTPTRRRLLRWLDTERESMPMVVDTTFVPRDRPRDIPRPKIDTDQTYRCNKCFDTGTVLVELPPEKRQFTGQMTETNCPECKETSA